jgi:hypothetical protein
MLIPGDFYPASVRNINTIESVVKNVMVAGENKKIRY